MTFPGDSGGLWAVCVILWAESALAEAYGFQHQHYL